MTSKLAPGDLVWRTGTTDANAGPAWTRRKVPGDEVFGRNDLTLDTDSSIILPPGHHLVVAVEEKLYHGGLGHLCLLMFNSGGLAWTFEANLTREPK